MPAADIVTRSVSEGTCNPKRQRGTCNTKRQRGTRRTVASTKAPSLWSPGAAQRHEGLRSAVTGAPAAAKKNRRACGNPSSQHAGDPLYWSLAALRDGPRNFRRVQKNMADTNSKNHWASLMSSLGLTPPEEEPVAEQPAPAPLPAAEPKPAPPVAPTPPPSRPIVRAANWDVIATDLGLPPPPPAPPAPVGGSDSAGRRASSEADGYRIKPAGGRAKCAGAGNCRRSAKFR